MSGNINLCSGNRNENFIPPLSENLFMKHDFFNLYPFDGGGRFIHENIIGTVRDCEIFEKIIDKDALSEFGDLPEIDFGKFERWITIEKSCWINRFYFIVPLALESKRRQCKELCRLVIDTMLFFARNVNHPSVSNEIIELEKRVQRNRDINYNGKSYEEYSIDETDVEYIWFDFQPASRIIHFIYTMHFLKDFKCISKGEWQELENSVKQHADIIALQESESILAQGNHQSLRGLALLFAAAFFRETEFAEKYIDVGLRVCNYHINNDYFEDGALKEISPSYHVFETWHVRDAYLLAQKYNFNISPKAYNVLKKARAFVKCLVQPDGLLPVINDGYELQLDGFLDSLEHFSEKEKALEIKVEYFQDSGIAFYKDKNKYLFLDFSVFPGPLSHYHCGKNSFVYWNNGKAIFVDSGCCGYDDPLFSQWYKTAQAHSTLLVENAGDGELRGTYEWMKYANIECKGWEKNGEIFSISSQLTSDARNWNGVLWERTFKISDKEEMSIQDKIHSVEKKNFCLIFNLHPDVDAEIKAGGKVELLNNEERFSLDFEPADKIKLKLDDGMVFKDFCHVKNKMILIEFSSCPEEILIKTKFKNIAL